MSASRKALQTARYNALRELEGLQEFGPTCYKPSMADHDVILDALCFLYLTFSHATDGELTGDEMRAVANKIREWAPNASLEVIGGILKKTVGSYKALPDRTSRCAQAAESAVTLRDNLSFDSLYTVLRDLQSIAEADGVVSEEEKNFIADIANKFGVSAAQ